MLIFAPTSNSRTDHPATHARVRGEPAQENLHNRRECARSPWVAWTLSVLLTAVLNRCRLGLAALWPQDGSSGLRGPALPDMGFCNTGPDAAEPPERTIAAESRALVSRRSRPGSIWSVRAAAFARCDLAAITRHGIVSPRRSSPSRGVAPTATPNQRPRISPAVDTDVESGELIEAQLPLVLLMHDASQSSQAGSCSGEPPRGNQGLSWGQDAHHNSMGTCGAR